MAAMTPAFSPCSKRIFPTGLVLVWDCVCADCLCATGNYWLSQHNVVSNIKNIYIICGK